MNEKQWADLILAIQQLCAEIKLIRIACQAWQFDQDTGKGNAKN